MKKVVELGKNTSKIVFSPQKKMVLLYRWVVLLTIPLLYILDPRKLQLYVFLPLFSAVMIYNILITIKSAKVKQIGKNANYLIVQLDAVAISVFVLFFGGLHSELYIVYFFMTAYCAIYDSDRRTTVVSFFSTIMFSIASLLNSRITGTHFNYGLLLFKDIYIIFFAYGISLVNKEIKKIDQMHKKEFMAARTDKLTGLANRHYFTQKLKDETEQADISSSCLNVIMFDLDNFKQFNDTYGHMVGDELLVLFSDIIKQNIRKTDIPVRYGGEEFLLLIRDLELKTAVTIAERICKQLEKQRIQVVSGGMKTIVTTSCGIAQYPSHSTNIQNIINYADKALYYAKNTGKNRVVTYDQISSRARNARVNN